MTATEKLAGRVRSMDSVVSTLLVLEEVAARQPIGVSQLARVTGMPKSSVQRCLVTLQRRPADSASSTPTTPGGA